MTEHPLPGAGAPIALATPVLPRRRYRLALVGVSVVAAVALAVGTATLVGAGEDEPTYSLLDAPTAIDQLDGLRYEVTFAGLPMLDDLRLSGTHDLQHERVELRIRLPEQADEAVRLVADLADEVVYVGGEVFEDVLPDDAAWVRIDRDAIGEISGLEGWMGELALDPVAALEDVDLARAVDEGFDEVDGIRTKRYSLTIEPDVVPPADEAGTDPIGQFFGQLLAGWLDGIELLLWVDEDNLVRQLRSDIDVLGFTMTITVRIDPTDATVELPDLDEVVDAPEILDLLR